MSGAARLVFLAAMCSSRSDGVSYSVRYSVTKEFLVPMVF